MLAKALSRSLDCSFSRIQFTPDLLPSDVTGVNVFNQSSNEFEFRPGPVFANLLLVDEINRASPKTQAALLEAMQENQVTIDGVTHPLARPFMVMATQNPIEYEGRTRSPRRSSTASRCDLDRLPAARRRGADAHRADGRAAPRRARAGATRDEVLPLIEEARESSSRRASTGTSSRFSGTRARSAALPRREPALGIALLRVAKAQALFAEGATTSSGRRQGGRGPVLAPADPGARGAPRGSRARTSSETRREDPGPGLVL